MNTARLLLFIFTLFPLSPVSTCRAAVAGSCDADRDARSGFKWEDEDSFLLESHMSLSSFSEKLGIQSLEVPDRTSLVTWIGNKQEILYCDQCSPLFSAGFLLHYFFDVKDEICADDVLTPLSIAGDDYTPLKVALLIGDFKLFEMLVPFYEDNEKNDIIKTVVLDHARLKQWALFEECKVGGNARNNLHDISSDIEAAALQTILAELLHKTSLQDFKEKLLRTFDIFEGADFSILPTWIECIENLAQAEARTAHSQAHCANRAPGKKHGRRNAEMGYEPSVEDNEVAREFANDGFHKGDTNANQCKERECEFIKSLRKSRRTLGDVLPLGSYTDSTQKVDDLFEKLATSFPGTLVNGSILLQCLIRHQLDAYQTINVDERSQLLDLMCRSLQILDIQSARAIIDCYKKRDGGDAELKQKIINFLGDDLSIDVPLACRFIASTNDSALFAIDKKTNPTGFSTETVDIVLVLLDELSTLIAEHKIDESSTQNSAAPLLTAKTILNAMRAEHASVQYPRPVNGRRAHATKGSSARTVKSKTTPKSKWNFGEGSTWDDNDRFKLIKTLEQAPETLDQLLAPESFLTQPSLDAVFKSVKAKSPGIYINDSILSASLTQHLLAKFSASRICENNNPQDLILSSLKILDIASARKLITCYETQIGYQGVKHMLEKFLEGTSPINVGFACRLVASADENEGALFAIDGATSLDQHSIKNVNSVLNSFEELLTLISGYGIDVEPLSTTRAELLNLKAEVSIYDEEGGESENLSCDEYSASSDDGSNDEDDKLKRAIAASLEDY